MRASDGGFGRGPLLTVGVNQRWRLAAVGRRRNRRVVGLPERDCDQDHGFDCHTHGLPYANHFATRVAPLQTAMLPDERPRIVRSYST